MSRGMRLKKYRRKKRSPVTQQRTVRVKGAIEILLRQQEGWVDKLHVRRIIDDWESIVGTFVASQSVPVSLLNGVLKVEVAHSTCWTELSAMKTQILSKLQKKLDDLNAGVRKPSKEIKITDMRFRLNPNISKLKPTENTDKSDSEVSERVAKPVPPEVQEQVEAAVSVVNDSELRTALKTLYLTQFTYTETAE